MPGDVDAIPRLFAGLDPGDDGLPDELLVDGGGDDEAVVQEAASEAEASRRLRFAGPSVQPETKKTG